MITSVRAGFFRDGYELGKHLRNDASKTYELLTMMLQNHDIDNAAITIAAIATQCRLRIVIPTTEFNLRKFLYGLSLVIHTKCEYIMA